MKEALREPVALTDALRERLLVTEPLTVLLRVMLALRLAVAVRDAEPDLERDTVALADFVSELLAEIDVEAACVAVREPELLTDGEASCDRETERELLSDALIVEGRDQVGDAVCVNDTLLVRLENMVRDAEMLLDALNEAD